MDVSVVKSKTTTCTTFSPKTEPESPSGVTTRVASVPVEVSAVVASSETPVAEVVASCFNAAKALAAVEAPVPPSVMATSVPPAR